MRTESQNKILNRKIKDMQGIIRSLRKELAAANKAIESMQKSVKARKEK